MMTSGSSSSHSSQKTGSPQSGEPVFLTIGKLQRTHGVKGEILMDVLTDYPDRIKTGNTVFIGPQHHEYIINSVRTSGDKLLVSFTGLSDCDQASILRNRYVFIKTEDAKSLTEGEFYHHEIIGMQVLNENGELIGSLTEILETGANDVYVVDAQNGEEILLPAIHSVILSTDRNTRKMIVRLPEWE